MSTMTKKYEIIEERLGSEGPVIGKRIKALVDFLGVKKGALGGRVSGEHNLSQEGTCWISYDATVLGNASVKDHAQIKGGAHVSGSSEISDHAYVGGSAIVHGAKVCDNANVYGMVSLGPGIKACKKVTLFLPITLAGEYELSEQPLYLNLPLTKIAMFERVCFVNTASCPDFSIDLTKSTDAYAGLQNVAFFDSDQKHLEEAIKFLKKINDFHKERVV